MILEDGSEIRKQLEELKDEQVIVEIESEVLNNQNLDTKEEVSELSGGQKTFYSAKRNNANQARSQSTSVNSTSLCSRNKHVYIQWVSTLYLTATVEQNIIYPPTVSSACLPSVCLSTCLVTCLSV